MRFPSAVSQNMTVLLSLGPVLLSWGPPIQANSFREIGQNSVKYRPTRRLPWRPLQFDGELHQKDLRILLYLGHIWGPAWRHVSTGGHVPGLKSNRRLFHVPAVINPPTCRHSGHNAVSKKSLILRMSEIGTFD